MTKTFAPILLAATIALGSFAPRQVQAGNNDFSNFMLGLTTLFVLGAALEPDKKTVTISRHYNNSVSNNNRRYRPPSYNTGRYRNPGHAHGRYRHHNHKNHKHNGHRHGKNRDKNRDKASGKRFQPRRGLPNECLRRVNTGNGHRNVYGSRCLRRQYGSMGKLPSQCERVVSTQNGRRRVFGARCLRTYGFGTRSNR